MKISFSKFKKLLKESSSSLADAYEDILCDLFDVDDISQIKQIDYEQMIFDYEHDQLNEHDSSMLESAEKIVLKAANQNGYNIIAHHGTTAKFSEFKKGDIGFHLGTLDQARIAGKGHAYGYENNIIYLNTAISLHNPLFINNDPESWDPEDIFRSANSLIKSYFKKEYIYTPNVNDKYNMDLIKSYIDSDIENKKLDIHDGKGSYKIIDFLFLYQLLKFNIKEIIDYEFSTNDKKKLIVDRLKSLGYDGIKYLNLYEVDGETDVNEYSYIVLDPNQIKNCEVISFKGGKVVPLEDRFNSSTNNLFETK